MAAGDAAPASSLCSMSILLLDGEAARRACPALVPGGWCADGAGHSTKTRQKGWAMAPGGEAGPSGLWLGPQQAGPIYRQIYERIRSSILEGQLRPGARLPS